MVGLGTLINAALALAGGIIGLVGGRFFTKQLQDTLLKAAGVAVIFIGIAGALTGLLAVSGGQLVSANSMMLTASLCLGAILGEIIDLEAKFETLGEWLKHKTGSEGDAGFVNAFVTSSLTICIGAMAIVGALQDGLTGDWSTLALKGALDAPIVCVMTASLGKGAVFSALPLAVFQGSITLLATFLQPIMTDAALANLSTVGSALIFCVGINLVWPKTFKTANMLPAVVIAVIAAFV